MGECDIPSRSFVSTPSHYEDGKTVDAHITKNPGLRFQPRPTMRTVRQSNMDSMVDSKNVSTPSHYEDGKTTSAGLVPLQNLVSTPSHYEDGKTAWD